MKIVVLVLSGIVLLSTLIYFTISLVSDKDDNTLPDQSMVQDIQDVEPGQVSPQPEIQTEQSKVSEKPVAKKKINLTGRWLTDENLEWKILQTGDEVEITRYNKKGNPTIVQGWINGNTMSYKKSKPGNDLEGKFTISQDGNSLEGIEYKVAGIKNRLKITRIQ